MRIVTPSSVGRDYDYLIVGSGPAGSVLASRLQCVGRVLVLDAGASHRGPLSRTPAYYPRCFGSRIDWGYQTAPQAQLANRRIAWPSGKTIGGSSAINAMIRIEPAEDCLEAMHDACGKDWSVGSIRRSFDELRVFWGGSLPLLHPNTCAVLNHAIDHDLGSQEGMYVPTSKLSPYIRMQSGGRRCDVSKLASCDVMPETEVRKLIFQSDRVTGVVACAQAETFELSAVKGVILCCGAIQTPRLLYQSGIGPGESLARAGLQCIHPSDGVGSGLQDHLIYPLVFRLRTGQSFQWPFSSDDRLRYIQERGGAKCSNLAELGAFVDPGGCSLNAYQWHVTPTHYLAYPHIAVPDPCVSVGITQCRPRSIGSIVPEDSSRGEDCSNGRVKVRIDPRYLSDSDDWEGYLRAIRWTREFFLGSAWGELLEEEIAPGEKRITDSMLRSHFERFATTLYHYSGTCAMGIDPNSPVDPRFRLRGFGGLRICDASVFPRILGCNPQTTIMMFALKLADWLIEGS